MLKGHEDRVGTRESAVLKASQVLVALGILTGCFGSSDEMNMFVWRCIQTCFASAR